MAPRAPKLLLLHPGTLYGGGAVGLTRLKPMLIEFSTFLRSHDVDVSILDLQTELGNPPPDKADEFIRRGLERILSFDFDVLGISCWSSYDYLASLAFANLVRAARPRTRIVVGGYHATAAPDDFVYAGSPFDVLVRGEGELALLDLLREGPTRGGAGPCKVVHGTPPPFDRLYFDLDSYPYIVDRPFHLGVFLSRGCPYRCAFCMDPAAGRTTWRSRSVEQAVELVRSVDAHEPGRLEINDACFGYKEPWRREFLTALVDMRFDRLIWAQMRADRMTSEDLDQFQDLNIFPQFGLETMSPSMAGIMRKAADGEAYVRAADKMLHEVNRRGILAKVFLILNHPGETVETAEETVSYFERFVAEHDRITLVINTEFFHYYVGTDTALRHEHYERTYGTRFSHTEWHKERRPQFELSRDQQASSSMVDIRPYVERIRALQPQIIRKMPAAQQMHFLAHLQHFDQS